MGKNYKKAVLGIILIVVAALLILKGMNPGFMRLYSGQRMITTKPRLRYIKSVYPILRLFIRMSM